MEINKGSKMPPEFCRPARRERGAYPQRSATSEQRSWAAKEQGRLPPLFISTALAEADGRLPSLPFALTPVIHFKEQARERPTVGH